MLIVAAVGGNALVRRGEPVYPERQRHNVAVAASALAPLASEHSVVITHGNGPQVGLLALESGSSDASPPYPLDIVGAESQGMIGYLLELALRNVLPGRAVATLLGQVMVDAGDPSFSNPSKPIGPFYSAMQAAKLESTKGWRMLGERSGFRRVVGSPEPVAILELDAIKALLGAGVITISAGGGGVPVVRQPDGTLAGAEGVVDKDLTAALLARKLGADALLLLTDVAAVHEDWPNPNSRTLRCGTPDALRALHLAPGSMGPKVEAACRFAQQAGGIAAIGALEQASVVLAGNAGTRVSDAGSGLEYWEVPHE